MHPMSNGLVRIQFRVDQDGQAPSFRLSEFSVNKVTTVIGNNANGSITNLPGGMGVPPMILAYDCEGNLACVSNAVSGAVSLYWYDQHGRRIAKQENGLLTLYIWDGMDIIATAHADGTLREYYTRGIGIAGDVGSLIAETRFENGAAVSTAYLHSNWRGDVVMATDTAGNVVGEYSYTTFGEQLSATGTYTPRFTFSSKERDASGLVYFGFRYYSPVLCRWISEDPIRESGGFNLYQFCWNNPVNLVDSWGRSTVEIITSYGVIQLTDPDVMQFVDAIDAQLDGAIETLNIYDHGTRKSMNIDGSGSGLVWSGKSGDPVEFDMGLGSFADLIRDKLAPNSNIGLYGCNTAREYPLDNTDNIARQLSRELTGISITGYAGTGIGNELTFWYLGFKKPLVRIGPTTINIGIKRSYKNGK